VYLHLNRWTSLGLSLIEAMHLGMPVVGVAATAAVDAVPSDAGVLRTGINGIRDAFRTVLHEPEAAKFMGFRARTAALRRFGLARFLADWDALLTRVVEEHRNRRARYTQQAPGVLPVLRTEEETA
jgi:glycosyltransferase involved in cell wall biosynthesis